MCHSERSEESAFVFFFCELRFLCGLRVKSFSLACMLAPAFGHYRVTQPCESTLPSAPKRTR